MDERRKSQGLWTLTAALTALAIGLLLPGCSLKGAVAPVPTTDQVQAVRLAAVGGSTALRTGLQVAGRVGQALPSLGVPVAFRDEYNCAMLKVTGVDNPTPLETKLCGQLPAVAASPAEKALELLRTAGTCPSLRSSLLAAERDVIAPLLAVMEKSTNDGIRIGAVSLRVSLSMLAGGAGTGGCQ